MLKLDSGVGARYRWFYPISSFVIACGVSLIFLWSMFFPYVRDLFGLETVAPIALASSFVGLGTMVIAPPLAGALFDRYGPKPPLGIAGVVFFAGFVILSAMMNYEDWTAGRYFWYGGSFTVGLGMGFFVGTFPSTVARWFPDKIGTSMGVAVSGHAAGSVVMAPVIGALITTLGFTAPVFIITGAVGFVLITAIGVLFWKVPPPDWTPQESAADLKPGAGEAGSEKHYTLGEAVKDTRFWFLMICFITAAFGFMGFAQNASMIVEEGLLAGGYGRDYIAACVVPLFLSLTGVANVLGAFSWGVITDKIGGPWNSIPLVYVSSALLIGGFYLGYEYLALVFVLGFILYFLFGGEPAVHFIIVPYVFGRKHIGKLMNIMNSFSVGLGITLGPIVYAQLRDITGGYILALLLAIALRIIATGFILAARRKTQLIEYK